MSNTVTMRASNNAKQAIFVAKSGNQYTSTVDGLILNVSSQDVNDLQNMGCTEILYSGLPWVTGRFYGAQPAGATQAAVLTVASTLYAYPIFIPNAVTLDTLSLSVGTGQTGGKGRAALYYDNGLGYPGAIVPGTDTGDLAATATAVVAKTAIATYLQPGIYWVASIFAADSTMPSVIGTTATYPNSLVNLLGSDTAAHALAVSGQAATGISKGSSTYPVTSMTVSFPTFPAGAALVLNATTPVLALGV